MTLFPFLLQSFLSQFPAPAFSVLITDRIVHRNRAVIGYKLIHAQVFAHLVAVGIRGRGGLLL